MRDIPLTVVCAIVLFEMIDRRFNAPVMNRKNNMVYAKPDILMHILQGNMHFKVENMLFLM